MGRIQSSVGLITGVPIEETVNQLMQINALPRNRLSNRNAELTKEQTAITTLTTLVIGVQLSGDRLGQASLFNSAKVTSSKPETIAARSTGTAALGNYSFIPVRQAQSQQLTSSLFASSQHKLSAGDITIHTGGFLDQSANLDQLNGGRGVERGMIRITNRAGTSREIDLRFVQTAADVVTAINSAEGLSVVAKINGGQFELTDVSGSVVHNLKIVDIGSGTTARDLGFQNVDVASSTAVGNNIHILSNATALRSLRDGIGIDIPTQGTALRLSLRDGSTVNWTSQLDAANASVGQLVQSLNTASNGKYVARISNDGHSLEVQDLTSGTAQFSISSPAGNLAQQLGLTGPGMGGTITGRKLLSGLSDTLLDSLKGGRGLGEMGSVTITDRLGQSDTIDLAGAKTLGDVIQRINDGASNASFRVQLNRTKTGIEIVDTSGGTGSLVIEDADSKNSATALGIARTTTGTSIDSGSLQRQFVSRTTSLDDFLAGGTLSQSSFRITNSAGSSATYNVSTRSPKTIGDIIDGINGMAIGVTASINHSGDGILLVDTAGGAGPMTVADVGTGSAAKQLRIAGSASTITIDDDQVSGIDGSKTLRMTTTATTTLADLTQQINELSGSPVKASLINLGASGVRLQLNGQATGQASRVAISSSSDIDFAQTSEARDALISYGTNNSGGGVLVSSRTNQFKNLIDGVDLTVNSTSTTPVTVEVSSNSDSLSKQIETFVDQYNKLREKYDELTVFDAQSNQVGLLFGSNIAIRMDLAYSRLLTGSIRSGSGGAIQSLPELGIRLNDRGRLTFDKQQFEQVLENNPGAVQDFFTNTENGFARRAKAVADSLASIESGSLLARNNSLQQTIEQNATRIQSMDLRLDRERTRLLQQFYNMEQAISRLQSNMTSVNQLQSLAQSLRSNR
ncbi:MAG: flagellar filament capping protein FliD [Pirellulaceae bacterium]|nr:flagellar filament capping protein FliD [Pirellulaceae bacterium]